MREVCSSRGGCIVVPMRPALSLQCRRVSERMHEIDRVSSGQGRYCCCSSAHAARCSDGSVALCAMLTRTIVRELVCFAVDDALERRPEARRVGCAMAAEVLQEHRRDSRSIAPSAMAVKLNHAHFVRPSRTSPHASGAQVSSRSVRPRACGVGAKRRTLMTPSTAPESQT